MEYYFAVLLFCCFVCLAIAEVYWVVIGYEPHKIVAAKVLRRKGVNEYDTIIVKGFFARMVCVYVCCLFLYTPIRVGQVYNIYAFLGICFFPIWFYLSSFYSFAGRKGDEIFVNSIFNIFDSCHVEKFSAHHIPFGAGIIDSGAAYVDRSVSIVGVCSSAMLDLKRSVAND